MSSAAKGFTIGVIQLSVVPDKEANLQRAAEQIVKAAQSGANVVVLPESFNCPAGSNHVRGYSEPLDGSSRTEKLISSLAQSLGIYIIAGTIPEYDHGCYYNSCGLFNRSGELVGKYRKKYVLSSVLGDTVCSETQVMSDGNEPVVFRTEYVDIGIGTGHDIRLPQLAVAYANAGCQMLVYCSAFTGPFGNYHWTLLSQGRALDSLSYVVLCSPGPIEDTSDKTFGYSTIVDPWGNSLIYATVKDEIIIEKFCPDEVLAARKKIPMLQSRRSDIYKDCLEIRPTIVGHR
uniref:omega-amidase n=1 Tax=Trichuris muris TaxID=70415 RepID=A0A5S6QXT3_TRIMR